MPVCVETCCLHSWFHTLWFSSLWKESCSSPPGLLHDMQSVGTIKQHSWAALKVWGSCTFKTTVSSKLLTLNCTSRHCSVRKGMNTTTNCVAFMVLSSVTGDGRKLSVSFLSGLFYANALTEASPQFKSCEFVCYINKVLEHRFSSLFFRNNGDLEVVSVVGVWSCPSSGFEWVIVQKNNLH